MWFAYHMYGPHVATLQVYTKSQGVNRPVIWQRNGSKGVNWRHAEVQVTVFYNTQVSLANAFNCLERLSLRKILKKTGFHLVILFPLTKRWQDCRGYFLYIPAFSSKAIVGQPDKSWV